MNTEWQVKPLSPKSSLSGESFNPGSKVTSYIYTLPSSPNELLRIDILEEESAHFQAPPNVIAQWTRIIKSNQNNEQKEAQKQILSNAEELFLSLYNNPETAHSPQENTNTQDILKQLLSLMLERKRILRRLNSKDKSSILYLHALNKQEYSVPQTPFNLEEIQTIQEQLANIIYY